MVGATRRLRRPSTMVAVSLLLHLAILLLFLREAPSNPPGRFDQTGVSVAMFDGRDRGSTAPPVLTSVVKTRARPTPPQVEAKPPPQMSDIEPIYEDSLPPVDPTAEPFSLDGEVALSVAAAASAASGQACDLTQWLQTALQNNPQSQVALAQIPRPARSVANALMLWNGRWVDMPVAAGGLQTLRAAVLAGVASAPAACRSEVIRGPVLLTLADPAGSTILAIGSGEWRWDDLSADDLADRPR